MQPRNSGPSAIRWTGPLAALGLALAGAGAAAEQSPARVSCGLSRSLDVTLLDGRLTLKARNAALAGVIAEIAREAGLAYVAIDPIEGCVNQRFSEVDLATAMRRLLNHKSYVVLYGGRLAPSQEAPGLTAVTQWTAERAAAPETTQSPREATSQLRAMRERADAGDELVSVELAVLLGDADALVRYEAVHALGEIGDELSLQLLEQAIRDADLRVREAAIEAYAEIGGPVSARMLAGVFAELDAELREGALHALAELDEPVALAALERARTDPYPRVREAALELFAERKTRAD